ncbi:MAG: lipopolysaccharide heptosyltransferase I [Candidatus Acidiferrum sp.]
MTEPRFLVVRLGSLGDILHTFPAVAALRQTVPHGEIVWLTHPRWESLVHCSGLASEIWTTETRSLGSLRKTIERVRRHDFSTAIDYQGLWKSASLPFLGSVKRRVGFSAETIREWGVPILYTDRVRARAGHIADQNGELSQCAGAARPVAAFTLHLPNAGGTLTHSRLESDPRFREFLSAVNNRYIVLSPGGGWRSKCWPVDRFAAVADRIHMSLKLGCVVNFGPGEDYLAEQIVAKCPSASVLPFSGGLESLMPLLRGALCVVGGDSGPVHLAVALGTSVVALFGPTDPARNGPYRCVDKRAGEYSTKDIVLRAPNVITTYRRADEPHPSMLEIKTDAVFEAVEGLVNPAV